MFIEMFIQTFAVIIVCCAIGQVVSSAARRGKKQGGFKMAGVDTLYMLGVMAVMAFFLVSAFVGMSMAKKREEGKK